MKKLITVLLIVIISFPLFSLDSSLSLGVQESRVFDVQHSYSHEFDPIYISIDLWQDIGPLRFYGNYKNEMSQSKRSWIFSPSQDFFTVGCTMDFEIVRVSVEHMCQHSVVSGYSNKGVGGGYSKVEITIGDKK